MKKATLILIGLSNLGDTLKIILKYEQKVYQINVIITLFLYLYLGFKVIIETSLFNYFHITLIKIFILFYLSTYIFFIERIFVEFNLKSKINLSPSNFIRRTNFILERTKKKYLNPKSKITFEEKIKANIFSLNEQIKKTNTLLLLETDELKTMSIKNENEVLKNSKKQEALEDKVFFNEKKITLIQNTLFKNEVISTNSSIKKIKNIFIEHKKELFENLNINSFINYIFLDLKKNKIQKNELSEQELKNVIYLLQLLIEYKKINKNISLICRILNNYFNIEIPQRTFSSKIKKNQYQLTNNKTITHIRTMIAKI